MTPKEDVPKSISIKMLCQKVEEIIVPGSPLWFGIDLEHTLLAPYDDRINYVATPPSVNTTCVRVLSEIADYVHRSIDPANIVFATASSFDVVLDAKRGRHIEHVNAYLSAGQKVLRSMLKIGSQSQPITNIRYIPDIQGSVLFVNDMDPYRELVGCIPKGWKAYWSIVPSFNPNYNFALPHEDYIQSIYNSLSRLDVEPSKGHDRSAFNRYYRS